MNLNELFSNPGSRPTSKRVGRGIGSGKGKTCGKGQKGQKARSGVSIKGFEGGQIPLHRAIPKRGFTNIFKKHFNLVNLYALEQAVADKKINPAEAITPEVLANAGVIRSNKLPLKVLGEGELNAKLNISANAFTKSAEAAIKKAGGSSTIIEG